MIRALNSKLQRPATKAPHRTHLHRMEDMAKPFVTHPRALRASRALTGGPPGPNARPGIARR